LSTSSPKTGPMLAVLLMSCATGSTKTCGREASSSVLLASSGVTSSSILVTHSVSMPTTSPSAGPLMTPSHSRIWSLQAALEPASERPSCCVLHTEMVWWPTPPCSGPACSEHQRPRGVADSCRNLLGLTPHGGSCSLWLVSDPRVLNINPFFGFCDTRD
uniref:Uncharacterized protein n=1 Tax=Spermophilus dauricus TaxID=99837 RepID=A0A8C9PQA8_SPEDA